MELNFIEKCVLHLYKTVLLIHLSKTLKRRNVLLSGCCNQVNYNRGCRKRGCFDVSSASLFNKTQKRKNERKEWYLGRKHLSYKN